MDLVNGVYEYEVELEDGHESIINVFLSNIRRPLLEDESVLYDEDGMVVVMNDSLVKYVCDQESRYIIRYDGSKFIRNKAIWISTAEIKYEGEILKIFYRGEIDINSSKMPEKGGVVEYYYNGRRISVDVLVEYEREEMAGVVREVENTGDYPNRSNHKLSMKLKKSTTNNKHYDKLIPVFYNSITNGRKSTICYSLLQHNKIANYFTFFINCGRVRVFITSRFINTVEMNNLIQSDKLDPEAIMAIPKESSRIQFNRNPINITNKFDQYMNLVVAPDQLIGGYSSDLLLNKDVEISHPNPFIILIKLLYSLKPCP
ncbi:hypothetical protein ECANGB1_1314 [Enterospora canceri]|uniref:Uncharacterized protein n=1 Tax=Enterospora canceri TaxID=1081671 RepID=A0A1Y1S713_9MICR|nr:hypothetical protein ECANGB1_1314 [Enterospora canceri]